jgi:environmental stress-induced protein Ves
MTVPVLRFAERPVMLWRNGRGHTREIACEPAGDAFDWRVSVAEVAGECEFSSFAGVDRVIVLCDGPAMTIAVDGTEHALTRHVPFAFPGESVTSCRVPRGPTRDLNVMTRRGRCVAEVSVIGDAAASTGVDDRRLTLVVALTGTGLVHWAASVDPVRLGVFDAVRLDSGRGLRIDGGGLMALIHIDNVHPDSA